MFPILQIGSLALRLPGLLILVGFWLATLLIDREAPRRGISGTDLNSMVFYALLGGLLGARLGYALRYLDIYLENPLAFVSLTPGTLSLLEGIAAAGIVALIYAQRRRLPFLPTLDALTPGLALFAVFVGIAHLSSGDSFGAVTQVPWAIELWGARRHPSQIYEIVTMGLIFILVWRIRSRDAFAGFLILAWLALTAAGSLILDGFRGDSVVVLGSLRTSQLLSLAILLIALAGLHVLARRDLLLSAPSNLD